MWSWNRHFPFDVFHGVLPLLQAPPVQKIVYNTISEVENIVVVF